MKRGSCARCTKRHRCRFRQPGTWPLECDAFEEDPVAVPVDLEPEWLEALDAGDLQPTASSSESR